MAKSKTNLQSGAALTAINGLVLKFIESMAFSEQWNGFIVLLATPFSITVIWLSLLFVKMYGAFSFDEAKFQRTAKKEIKKNKKILKSKKYTPDEKVIANKAINCANSILAKHNNQKLKDLSELSQTSNNSFESFINNTAKVKPKP